MASAMAREVQADGDVSGRGSNPHSKGQRSGAFPEELKSQLGHEASEGASWGGEGRGRDQAREIASHQGGAH